MLKKNLIVPAALALVTAPGMALATTTAPATPDFSALTDYITACIPVGVAALGLAIMAALAFSIVVKIGRKITGAA